MTNTIEKLQNPYMVTFFMTMIFTVSFLSGSPWHFVISGAFLFFFIGYSFVNFLRSPISIADIVKQNPVTYTLLVAFLLSSLASLFKVWLLDVSALQKIGQSLKYAYYLVMLGFCLSLAWFASVNRIKHSNIFLIFSYGLWVLLLQFFILYYFFDAPNYDAWARNPPLGGNIRLVGLALGFAISVLLSAVMFQSQRSIMQFFHYLSLFVFTAALAWSGSRTSLALVYGIFFVLILLQMLTKQLSISRIVLVALVLLGGMLLGGSLPLFSSGGIERFYSFFQSVSDHGGINKSVVQQASFSRTLLWQHAWEVIQQTPILGIGPFGYFFQVNAPEHTDHVHNIFLQFFLEWGLLGGTLLILLLANILFHASKVFKTALKNKHIDYLMMFSALLFLTLNGLTDGTYSALLPIFLVVTAYSFLLVKPLQCLIQQSQP